MKKTNLRIVFLTVFAVLLLALSSAALAHPGRTDAYGGHTDHSTGQYHYHHGHEAHQHPDGVCPFGDYEEWLAQHGSKPRDEAEVQANVKADAARTSLDEWVWIGGGAGAAAAASAAGYGLYRKSRKHRPVPQGSDDEAVYDDDPHTIVYVANNGSRYHKHYGCCNAMQEMELGKAKAEGRIQCPICYNDELYAFITDPAENGLDNGQAVNGEATETAEDDQDDTDEGMTDQEQQSPRAS